MFILRISAAYLPQVVGVYENKQTEGAAFVHFDNFLAPGRAGVHCPSRVVHLKQRCSDKNRVLFIILLIFSKPELL